MLLGRPAGYDYEIIDCKDVHQRNAQQWLKTFAGECVAARVLPIGENGKNLIEESFEVVFLRREGRGICCGHDTCSITEADTIENAIQKFFG